jgi:hypothetical protein
VATALAAVVAALSFAYSVWSKREEQKSGVAGKIREALGEMSLESYLLSWTLINDSPLHVGVAGIVRELRERFAEHPSKSLAVQALKQRAFVDSVISYAWHQSRVIEKLEEHLRRIRGYEVHLNNYFPFIENIIEKWDGKLRTLYILDALLAFHLRDESVIKEIDDSSGSFEEMLFRLESSLYYSQRNTGKINSSELDTFFNCFYSFANALSDKQLLKLSKYCHRIGRDSANYHSQLSAIREHLWRYFDEGSLNGFLEAFDAVAKLFEESADAKFERFLHRLKSAGTDDPDVDLFLSVFTESTEEVKTALERGANPHVTQGEIIRRYEGIWKAEFESAPAQT